MLRGVCVVALVACVLAEPEKRFLLDTVTGDGTQIAICEATLSKSSCESCCDNANWGLVASVEIPICRAACAILGKKREATEKRFLLDTVTGDGTQIAICEATLSKSSCESCCDNANWGLVASVEIPICKAACAILGKKREAIEKRFLLDTVTGDGTQIAICEATLSKSSCESCCDNANWGLVASVEIPICRAACAILGKKREATEKRFLLDTVTGDGTQIAICEATLSKSSCESCCDNANWGLVASVEIPICKAACAILG